MTATTDDRRARTASDLLPFLPIALVVILLGVVGLLALVAPGRVSSGIYQISVGQGATQFTLANESLTCKRTGDTATCTAPVAGKELAVTIDYHGPGSTGPPSTCRARHGDRPVHCGFRFGDYGHASFSVWISEQLGVTEPELTRLRDAVPWWRTVNGVQDAAFVLLGVLTVAAGAAAYLLSRRARPRASEWRLPTAIGTGLLGLALFAVSGLLSAPSPGDGSPWLRWLMAPPSLISFAVLAAWQGQLVRADGTSRGKRWAYAISAALATAVYTAVALLIFLLNSGFVD